METSAPIAAICDRTALRATTRDEVGLRLHCPRKTSHLAQWHAVPQFHTVIVFGASAHAAAAPKGAEIIEPVIFCIFVCKGPV